MRQSLVRFLACVMLAVLLLPDLARAQFVPAEPPLGPNDRRVLPRWCFELDRRLFTFGHRNWIVIADSAYPAQSRAGIETIATGAEQIEVLKYVLDAVAKTKHVRPNIYLDAELPHVSNEDARGIDAYREQLQRLVANRKPQSLPHEQIIEKLDKAGEKFHILILKTNMTLPYTSVFIELDCGYWSADAEKRLREAMNSTEKKQ